jgi:outer membrane protein TolC
MKYLIITILTLCIYNDVVSQRIAQVPDSIRKKYAAGQPKTNVKKVIDLSTLNQDSLIKIRLVSLAMSNPAMNIADANVRIAEAELDQAKTSWLGSINAGANVNEFVIQGSAAASFFPKYNIGVAVPFNILTKLKRDKKVARENIYISKELKKNREHDIKTEVLLAYENYKEKNELVFIQKSSIEYDFSNYEAAKRSYSDGDISIDDMNKSYQLYLVERSKLISKEKELNHAIIILEQIVGVPIAEALKVQ